MRTLALPSENVAERERCAEADAWEGTSPSPTGERGCDTAQPLILAYSSRMTTMGSTRMARHAGM